MKDESFQTSTPAQISKSIVNEFIRYQLFPQARASLPACNRKNIPFYFNKLSNPPPLTREMKQIF
jgi:hypothetical protein